MNRLGQETSPYLLQHRDNPVHWRAWSADVFAEAAARDVPILLSVGYSACHWCHVMAHESFENAAIAAAMNASFINVKLDREERPDVDAIYQGALALLGQHGGWPLTMFLTPSGEPFWGGTYFPPDRRHGRPGFIDVLRSIAEAWRTRQDAIDRSVAALRDALAAQARPAAADRLVPGLADRAARLAAGAVDLVHGGTLGAPKFPQPSVFRLLWRAYRRVSAPVFRNAVTLTLDRISQGGIYDHLGGGFARYSTDEAWLAPHFEKMLYDNALLLELLADAWAVTRSPLYRARAEETVAWLLSDMKTGEGEGPPGAFGLASARDADSEGEEGKYYVWNETEIDAALGADADRFKAAYDVTRGGNWEGHTILNRTHAPELGNDPAEADLATMRARLLARRARRTPPLRDDKVLADWNGMAAAALAHAGAIFARPDWVDAAKAVYRFVESAMSVNGRLRHSWRSGRARHPATLDDHAQLARAALKLFEATQDEAYIAAAEHHADAIERHYRDPAGGYFLSADDTSDVIVRTKTAFDNAVPSGNGAAAEALALLWLLTGKDDYRARAEAAIRAFAGEGAERLVHMPTLLGALELLEGGTQVVIAGPQDGARLLLQTALRHAPPLRVIRRVGQNTELPPAHPAHGKGPVDGRAAAYVCVGQTCRPPLCDAALLAAALDAAPESSRSEDPR